jgi:hypothetical protein
MAEWKESGAVFYCLISLTLSIIFVAGVSRNDALRVNSTMKGVGLGILSVEIMSQLLLAITPILQKMTAAATLQWYDGLFIIHMIAGAVLGAVVGLGLQLAGRGSRCEA